VNGSIDILLVEDNEGDAHLTREALKRAKVRNRVHTTSDGVEAMQFLRREGTFADAPRPDLILLDLNLPNMDGREVLEAIKADRFFRGSRPRGQGAGLGLAIARALVEAHGGRIGVGSAPSGGARFFFTLPRTALG
jgi:CheY-like chemotaxis protein